MTERAARLLQPERVSHEREVEQMMLAQKQLEMEDALTEEKDLQEALIKLEQERVGERTDELRAAFLEDEKRQQAGFQQRLQEAEVQILAEERQRFELVREELAKRARRARARARRGAPRQGRRARARDGAAGRGHARAAAPPGAAQGGGQGRVAVHGGRAGARGRRGGRAEARATMTRAPAPAAPASRRARAMCSETRRPAPSAARTTAKKMPQAKRDAGDDDPPPAREGRPRRH